jgi:hypothetical protein
VRATATSGPVDSRARLQNLRLKAQTLPRALRPPDGEEGTRRAPAADSTSTPSQSRRPLRPLGLHRPQPAHALTMEGPGQPRCFCRVHRMSYSTVSLSSCKGSRAGTDMNRGDGRPPGPSTTIPLPQSCSPWSCCTSDPGYAQAVQPLERARGHPSSTTWLPTCCRCLCPQRGGGVASRASQCHSTCCSM